MSSEPKPIMSVSQTADGLSATVVQAFKKAAYASFWKQNIKPIVTVVVIAIVFGVGAFLSFKKGSKGLGITLASISIVVVAIQSIWMWYLWGIVSSSTKVFEAAVLKKSA